MQMSHFTHWLDTGLYDMTECSSELSCQWSGNPGQAENVCRTLSYPALKMWNKVNKESQLHGQAPHSQRPGAQPAHLELRENKTNIYLSFGLLTTYNLVSSPNVERKTRSLTLDEVRSSRERMPEYCTNSNSGQCCGGICAKKQRSEGGHYRPFWWGRFCCPKMKGEAKIMCSL